LGFRNINLLLIAFIMKYAIVTNALVLFAVTNLFSVQIGILNCDLDFLKLIDLDFPEKDFERLPQY
jgi:hypothetical protein